MLTALCIRIYQLNEKSQKINPHCIATFRLTFSYKLPCFNKVLAENIIEKHLSLIDNGDSEPMCHMIFVSKALCGDYLIIQVLIIYE